MLPQSLQNLIQKIRILPGVGQKTAQRYALQLIERHRRQSKELALALNNALDNLQHCHDCGMLKEIDQPCPLCTHPGRDHHTLLILPSLFDVIHFEQLKCYKGLYHVLGGQLSPLDGIGPDQLHMGSIRERVLTYHIQEVILALSPTLEGEATAYYVSQLIQETPASVTRLATGIPVGGDLEHIDAHTLTLSLKQRSSYHNQ